MKLAELVTTTDRVGATSSRLAKIDALAELLARADTSELPIVVGPPPRGTAPGAGWASDGAGSRPSRSPHSDESTLTVGDVDDSLDALASTSGSGSAAGRTGILIDLGSRATAAEWDFLVRAMLGELRTGALSGVLLDAIARAGRPSCGSRPAGGDAVGRPRRDRAHRPRGG